MGMIQQALQDSWSFYKIHFIALVAIILPIAIPLEIFLSMYSQTPADVNNPVATGDILMPALASMLIKPIYSIAVIYFIGKSIRNESADTVSLWMLGINKWLPYVILMFLIVVATGLGLLLFIIPGIIISLRLAFAEFELLIGEQQPIDALKNSWEATREYVWVILGGLVIISVIYMSAYFLLSVITKGIGLPSMMQTLIISIIFSVLGAFYTVYLFRVYEYARDSILPDDVKV